MRVPLRIVMDCAGRSTYEFAVLAPAIERMFGGRLSYRPFRFKACEDSGAQRLITQELPAMHRQALDRLRYTAQVTTFRRGVASCADFLLF
jgi:hypothetical protein